jgi:hypothetical protein
MQRYHLSKLHKVGLLLALLFIHKPLFAEFITHYDDSILTSKKEKYYLNKSIKPIVKGALNNSFAIIKDGLIDPDYVVCSVQARMIRLKRVRNHSKGNYRVIINSIKPRLRSKTFDLKINITIRSTVREEIKTFTIRNLNYVKKKGKLRLLSESRVNFVNKLEHFFIKALMGSYLEDGITSVKSYNSNQCYSHIVNQLKRYLRKK